MALHRKADQLRWMKPSTWLPACLAWLAVAALAYTEGGCTTVTGGIRLMPKVTKDPLTRCDPNIPAGSKQVQSGMAWTDTVYLLGMYFNPELPPLRRLC